jgi:hypothetical protein
MMKAQSRSTRKWLGCSVPGCTYRSEVVRHHDSYSLKDACNVRALCRSHHAMWHARNETHDATIEAMLAYAVYQRHKRGHDNADDYEILGGKGLPTSRPVLLKLAKRSEKRELAAVRRRWSRRVG